MYTGAPMLVDFYMSHNSLSREAANCAVLEGPDSIAAALLVFGGGIGAVVMFIGQAKAQVLNTYSASLALSVIDYYFVSRRLGDSGEYIAPVNWAGVTTVVGAAVISNFVLNNYIPVQFAVTLVLCAMFYLVLRLGVLRPRGLPVAN